MKKNESNEIIKNDFTIDRSGASHEKQKEIFNKLLAKRASQIDNVTNLIDPNILKRQQRSKRPQRLSKSLKSCWKI